jgi:hypothetical protein
MAPALDRPAVRHKLRVLSNRHEANTSLQKDRTYAVVNVESFANEVSSCPCLGDLLSYKPNTPLFYEARVRYV